MRALKIKNKYMKLYPRSGIAGLTEFKAEFVFSNIPIFKESGW